VYLEGNKKWHFSVKSAYYLRKEIELKGLAEISSVGVKRPI
jgi:hypothetical protein